MDNFKVGDKVYWSEPNSKRKVFGVVTKVRNIFCEVRWYSLYTREYKHSSNVKFFLLTKMSIVDKLLYT